jgi:hypothetical protein
LSEGAVAFFQKPVNNDELLVTIRQLLGTNPAVPPPLPSQAG